MNPSPKNEPAMNERMIAAKKKAAIFFTLFFAENNMNGSGKSIFKKEPIIGM
jgi:hypothetical protein